jgi:hypothetical protein
VRRGGDGDDDDDDDDNNNNNKITYNTNSKYRGVVTLYTL